MRALLLQSDSGADHFAGVDSCLASMGVEVVRALPDALPPRLPEGVGVVCVADALRPESVAALRLARAHRLPSVLLMDGIVEWRNTFTNPRVDHRFLRPAPVDMVACAGWIDRCRLRAWGNDARATGLPRLGGSLVRTAPGDRLMIATARRPSFTSEEHRRLLAALESLRDASSRVGLDPIWRVDARLGDALGVRPDTRPLSASLLDARAVVTTVSTLLIESMRAGRATAVLHPHDTPLWHHTPWVWRPNDPGAPAGDDLIDRVMNAGETSLGEQERMLARAHRTGDPSLRVARLIRAVALHGTWRASRPLPSFGRPLTPRPRPGAGGLLRVCVIDGTPASADSDTHERARRSAAGTPASHPGRTLVILTNPCAPGLSDCDRSPAPGEHVLALDPTEDHTVRLERAFEAMGSLAPVHVDPGPTDLGRQLARATHDGLSLGAAARWNKPWSDDPDGSRRWILTEMRRRGFASIGATASSAHDGVVLEEAYTPELHRRVRAMRRNGIGVAVAPALIPPVWVIATVQMMDMLDAGARRLAVFGGGAHTRRLARLFERDLPIVAVLDDEPSVESIHGVPVVAPNEGVGRLGVEGVLISSDAHERSIWTRCAPLRRAGVRVRTIYSGAGPSWLDGASAPEIPERKSA